MHLIRLLLLSLLLLESALVCSAPGEIYRCRDASGALRFQDKPCAGVPSTRIAGGGTDTADSQRALRQWLDAQRPAPAVAPSTRRIESPARPITRSLGGAVSQAQLAMCSERFLHCANGDGPAMDACVGRLPRCAGRQQGQCCPQACISRYQSLRLAGQPLAAAVRLALLNPNAPACAAPD